MIEISVAPHPTLLARAFATTLPAPLADMPCQEWLVDLLRLNAPSPIERDEPLRAAVRDMLRHGGYKPTGRGKPASEYLVRTATETGLRSINLAVDACNAVSLHSGIPISVIDTDRARPPFTIRIATEGETYVFNATGQEIDVSGLVCLCDADGPCGNAVKDAQRTKTDDRTRTTLSILWGCAGFETQIESALTWYGELLTRAGARIDECRVTRESAAPSA